MISSLVASSLFASLATCLAAPSDLVAREPAKCTDFMIPITATAKTFKIGAIPENLSDPTVLQSFLISQGSAVGSTVQAGTAGTSTKSGTYHMSARYCEPTVYNAKRAHTLQYLQHAITMTKNYWTGLNYPKGFQGTAYSYQHTLAANGYPSLAVDNLGSGESDHPDPINTVQMGLQVEVIHGIISKMRAGEVNGPVKGRKFNKVIYTGHSYGSITGNALATTHPNDVDAFVLTAYSAQFVNGTGPLAAGIAIPAREVMKRFAGLNPGYLAQSFEPGRQVGLYTTVGGFDPEIVPFDFAHEGTVAIGELATLFYGIAPADDYKGHVLAVTGQLDAIVCNHGVDSPECGTGANAIPRLASTLFPNAKSYTAHIPPRTGHNTFMHYTAQSSFKFVMKYLTEKGF